MALVPTSSHAVHPEKIAEAIARKQGWTAPTNVIALTALAVSTASLAITLFALLMR